MSFLTAKKRKKGPRCPLPHPGTVHWYQDNFVKNKLSLICFFCVYIRWLGILECCKLIFRPKLSFRLFKPCIFRNTPSKIPQNCLSHKNHCLSFFFLCQNALLDRSHREISQIDKIYQRIQHERKKGRNQGNFLHGEYPKMA